MTTRLKAIGMLLLIGFAAANAESRHYEATSNLLSNGSFENGDYSPTGTPSDWEPDAWQPSAIFAWDNTQAHSGTKSIKIFAPSENDARWVQSAAVEPNTLHFLSGWIKTENVDHSSQSVDAGANLSLYGTWERSDGVFGSQKWTRGSFLFNSGDSGQVSIAARLGSWAGITTGTAWFDDLQLRPIVPMDPHPAWKILVLIYQDTDFEVTDDGGVVHRYVASMTHDESQKAALAAKRFVEVDIPALTSGNMVPEVSIRFPDHALSHLSPTGGGYWPSPEDTAEDRDPEFDSVIVIWDTRAVDVTTGEQKWIGRGDGLAQPRGVKQTYFAMQIAAAIERDHRNVFKHEWGHSLLYFFDATGNAPKPSVTNHAHATQYVNCETGQLYVWQYETTANPIPNSIYSNESGFTHDYYSGKTATLDQPTRCLGVTPQAWAFGGPVSHSGNIEVPEPEPKRALLIVRRDGKIGDGAPCPVPRTRNNYSTIPAAVYCARNGDRIFVPRGVFEGGASIDKHVTISGRGPNKTVLIGGFDIRASVTMKHLTISKPIGAGSASDGGLLETLAPGKRLIVEDCWLVNGRAGDGGAIKINFDTEVVIKNSVLSANQAFAGIGGAITNEGTLRISDSIISGNSADFGAGIYNRGRLFVMSSVITGNHAASDGGGIFNEGGTVTLWNKPKIFNNSPTDCVGCP